MFPHDALIVDQVEHGDQNNWQQDTIECLAGHHGLDQRLNGQQDDSSPQNDQCGIDRKKDWGFLKPAADAGLPAKGFTDCIRC